jgi:peptidoglycan hydrolase-like protein with peptidoglycan-binding domain
MPFPFVPVALGGVGLFAGYKLFFEEKTHIQRLHASDPETGAGVDVAVPTTSEAPVLSQSVTPPTSDSIAQVPSEDSLGVNTVVEQGPNGPIYRHHRRRYLAPPIVPGMLPLAPTVFTPYGPAPMTIRSPQDIQYALNALGHGPIRVSGAIDPDTQRAIFEFQRSSGLAQTGLIPETRAHLQNAVQAMIPKPGTMRVGVHMGAESVVHKATKATPVAVAVVTKTPPITTPHAVQVALNKTGANPPLKVDGELGPKTVAATKAFQVVHGLLVDGVPGPKTRTALAIACLPPVKKTCIPTPYVDRMPGVKIPCTETDKFLKWAETHHLNAVNPLYYPSWSGATPPAPEVPWGPQLMSRNERFLHWAACHHLETLVDAHRSMMGLDALDPSQAPKIPAPPPLGTGKNPPPPFLPPAAVTTIGIEGPTGTDPEASAYFKGAHLPFGADGSSDYYDGASTYFNHAHLPFGIEGASGSNPEASAYFKHAHLPFGAAFGGGSFAHSNPQFGGGSFAHSNPEFGAWSGSKGGGGGHTGGRGNQTGPSTPTTTPITSSPSTSVPMPPAPKTSSTPSFSRPTSAPTAPSQPTFTPPPPGQGQSSGFTPAPSSGSSGGFIPAPSSGGYGGGFAPAPSGGYGGGFAPAPSGGYGGGFAPAPSGGYGGGFAPAPSGGYGGGFAPAPSGGYGGGFAPAPSGGGFSPYATQGYAGAYNLANQWSPENTGGGGGFFGERLLEDLNPMPKASHWPFVLENDGRNVEMGHDLVMTHGDVTITQHSRGSDVGSAGRSRGQGHAHPHHRAFG